ncbi:MAG: hypothetical protein AAB597_01080 [Patescibacteria group bacterium]
MTDSYKKLVNKTLSVLFICVLSASPIFGLKTAKAQLPVIDTASIAVETANVFQSTISAISDKALEVKEYVLDQLAWDLANIAIQQISQSTIRWINSGFEGGPAYVTNPEAFFADLVDNEIGAFFEGSGLGFLCSPFQAQVRLALLLNRSYKYKAACTLTKVVKNFDDFVSGSPGSFSRGGGWNGWFALTTQEQNNPYGAYLLANAELDARIARRYYNEQKKQDWGRGFLSFQKCKNVEVPYTAGYDSESVASTQTEKFCEITNPGAVVQTELESALNLPKDRLLIADEINEVLSALFTQLSYQIITTGLSGLSQSSGSGEPSFEEQLYQDIGNQGGSARATIANQIDKDASIENQYLATKQQMLGRANQSEQLLKDLISCLNDKIRRGSLTGTALSNVQNDISNASSTISNQVNPVKTNANRDIASSNSNLTRLKGFKDQTGVAGLTELNGLINDYLSFRGTLHTESSVFNAERDLNSTVTTLNSLDTDTNQRISTCRSSSSTP